MLPIARTRAQLALSSVALAVISERPADSLLKELAVASETSQFCTERHYVPKSPGSKEQKPWEIPCKDLHENLGAVLRWRFTERAKPTLATLANEHVSDAVVARGIQRLLVEFDTFGWQISKDVKSLRDKVALFPTSDEQQNSRFCTCPELAIREDLPDLCLTDQQAIARKVERAFASPHLHEGYYHTEADSDIEYHLSWFARYHRQKLIEVSSRFRLAALARADVARALDFVNQLPYDETIVSPSDLFTAAKSFVQHYLDRPPARFEWSVLETHVLAFTCFGPEELRDWLLFSSEHRLLRREIHYYPIPLLAPLLINDELAALARQKAKENWNVPGGTSKPPETVFDFWACVGGVAGSPDADYHAWIDAQIRQQSPGRSSPYYAALLWFRTATEAQLDRAVSDGTVVDLFSQDGFRPIIWSGRAVPDWSRLSIGVNSLAQRMPADDVGTLLFESNRHGDLSEWGEKLFRRALELVGAASFERQFWGRTIYTRNQNGRIIAAGCDRENPSGSMATDPLRPVPPSEFSPGFDTASIKEQNRQANEALDIWHQDLDALSAIDRDTFNRFGAYRALARWRDRHPEIFEAYAAELLDKVIRDAAKAFHIGGFLAAVVDALIPLNPRKALEADEALRNTLRINLVNEYGESTFEASMWHEAPANHECRSICEGWIECAVTDEKLMSHAIMAQAEGAVDELLTMCGNLVLSQLAKLRALAVSLLPWVADEVRIRQLLDLSRHDSSGWVRAHAEWASEVAQQEFSARTFYSRTLESLHDSNEVLTRLQVLKPAITPAADWWHLKIENESPALDAAPAKTRAALSSFWYDYGSKSRKSTRLFGREIAEYIRGERIRDLRAPRPRLLGD